MQHGHNNNTAPQIRNTNDSIDRRRKFCPGSIGPGYRRSRARITPTGEEKDEEEEEGEGPGKRGGRTGNLIKSGYDRSSLNLYQEQNRRRTSAFFLYLSSSYVIAHRLARRCEHRNVYYNLPSLSPSTERSSNNKLEQNTSSPACREGAPLRLKRRLVRRE